MKNTRNHTTLRKILFLIESLPSAELLSRTLMALWMAGYEAERIPIEQILTQMSYFIVTHGQTHFAASTCGTPPANNLIPQNNPYTPDALSAPDSNPGANTTASAALCTGANPEKHPLAPTHLIVTDRADIAKCCMQHGFAVIGYLHGQDQIPAENKDASFDGVRYLIEDISGLDASFCELAFCRTHRLPYTVLETERCLVREITLADVDRLYEIYADPGITRYIETLYADETAERSYIRDYIDNVYGFFDYGMWIVVNKEDGQIIGRAGIEPKEDFAELGYVIAREYQNRGYATEVCRAILAYAADRLGLPNVYVRVQKENAASLRICEKLHFQPVPHTECPDDSNNPDMLLFMLRLN
ncbi:MAG: GNAT family N-acetyltransferase [Clostridium sp.]|nr:GNAT family N-acetyltransferase [Clostridium sp.]